MATCQAMQNAFITVFRSLVHYSFNWDSHANYFPAYSSVTLFYFVIIIRSFNEK